MRSKEILPKTVLSGDSVIAGEDMTSLTLDFNCLSKIGY